MDTPQKNRVPLKITSAREADYRIDEIKEAASMTADALFGRGDSPLDLMRKLKFEPKGRHPLEERELNLIEQVNQTWTYLAALAATKKLLSKHPKAGGFLLAPGAHAAQELDIMSVSEGLVGAETFAAVHPKNNRKLARDLDKLVAVKERFKYRYVFFISPVYPGTKRREELERDGIQVWSLSVEGF